MKNKELTPEMMKTHVLGIRMNSAEKQIFENYCEEHATTMSKVARRLFSKLINGEISL